MTRNQRLRKRLRIEKIQARRSQLRKNQAIRTARKEQLMKMILSQKPDKNRDQSTFEAMVYKKAPKVSKTMEATNAVKAMEKMTQIRPLQDWRPKGKSTRAKLNSLANYLFARWTMPEILWSAFWDDSSRVFKNAVVKVACGASLFALCQSGEFPMKLSRKQCHRLLQMPARYSLMQAIRLIQTQDLGGDQLLFNQWWQTRQAKRCHTAKAELFWLQFVNWLVLHGEHDKRLKNGSTVAELAAWLDHEYSENNNFSIKGRSVNKVFKNLAAWRREKRLLQQWQGIPLPSSGFSGLNWTHHGKSGSAAEGRMHWEMEELLSTRDLFDEGKAMRHCVYSYRDDVRWGNSSIWKLSVNGRKCVTVELLNHKGLVAQIRGKANRLPNEIELKAVDYWCQQNGVLMANG